MLILQRIQIRYFPPGINLVYKNEGKLEQKEIDLYSFDPFDKNYQSFVQQIIKQEPQILSNREKEVQEAIAKIHRKYNGRDFKGYKLAKSLKAHKQPLTNCMFSKYGDKFATASYDRTCCIWSTDSGKLFSTLIGHKNAIFCIDFSRFSQRQLIATGSLDHNVKLWSSSGSDLSTFKDHKAQVTSVKFNANGKYLISASFDNSIKLWDIQKGKLLYSLLGHEGQVIKLDQNYNGDLVLSCSFDYTAKIWDLKTKSCVRNLVGHQGEINCCQFQYTGQICATGSNDKTCTIWDVGSGKTLQILKDHVGELYDLSFSKQGNLLATCSSDSSAKIYSTNTSAMLHNLEGHSNEVTRVLFNSEGNKVVTTGMDGIGRIWDAHTGSNIGLLEGHSDQIFSCDISYFSDHIITCSKDNICNVWSLAN